MLGLGNRGRSRAAIGRLPRPVRRVEMQAQEKRFAPARACVELLDGLVGEQVGEIAVIGEDLFPVDDGTGVVFAAAEVERVATVHAEEAVVAALKWSEIR